MRRRCRFWRSASTRRAMVSYAATFGGRGPRAAGPAGWPGRPRRPRPCRPA
jgi:hypothetical protein